MKLRVCNILSMTSYRRVDLGGGAPCFVAASNLPLIFFGAGLLLGSWLHGCRLELTLRSAANWHPRVVPCFDAARLGDELARSPVYWCGQESHESLPRWIVLEVGRHS